MTAVVGLPLFVRRNLFLLLILLVFSTIHAFPQDKAIEKNVSNLEKEARELFQKKDFISALPLYSQLLSLEPKDPDLNYRFGVCLLMGDRRDLERPLRFLEIAVKNPDIEKEAFFYLGLAYHFNYRFSDAITLFNRYIGMADPSKVKELQVTRQIEMCENGFMLLSDVSDIYVLSRSQVDMTDFYRAYQLKNFGGEFLLKPDIFKSKIDKKNKDNDVMFFPQVLDEVFFASYGDDLKNGRDIFHAYREPDGSWGKPIRLVGEVNSSFDEAFPYLLPDGKTLYFCSKGHNSMGGYDVFLSRLDTMTGRWGKPENLDFAVNTPFDDLLFVTDKSKRIAYFASNRSSSGKQVNVYKVRIDKRPEKSRDIALQPLSAQGDGNRTRYEQSLAIIREMSRLDVNTGSEALADTSGPAPEIPVILAKTRQEPESVPLALSREQKMAKAVADKKEVQAKVDSAYQRVEQMSQSLKAFEKVTENAGQLANKLSDPRQKSIAQTVVKELDKTAKGKYQRLENSRYRAGLMQQLVATGKSDSALQVYSYFKNDITEIDTLTDFSEKLREDARIAISGVKPDAPEKDVVFQAEELKKARKDSVFILSFVENSISAETVNALAAISANNQNADEVKEENQPAPSVTGKAEKPQPQTITATEKPATVAPGLLVGVTEIQRPADKDAPVAVSVAAASEEDRSGKQPVSPAGSEKTMAAAPVKGKDYAAECLEERKDSLVNYLGEIESEQSLAAAFVAENLAEAETKIIAFQELAGKKIGKNESPEARELKLQSVRNEAVTRIARAKVAEAYAELLNQASVKAIDGIQQLDSLEKALGFALNPGDVQKISQAMDEVRPGPAELSVQEITIKLKQEIRSQRRGEDTGLAVAQYLASESIILDSLSQELISGSENADSPARAKEMSKSADSFRQKSREAGRKALAENDEARAQVLLLHDMNAVADTFSLVEYIPAETGIPGKEKTSDKKSKGVESKPLVREDLSAIQTAIVELSPALAVSNSIGKPEQAQQYLLEKQKAILPEDPEILAQGKDEVMRVISTEYPEEIAVLGAQNIVEAPPADQPAAPAVSGTAAKTDSIVPAVVAEKPTQTATGLTDQQIQESSEALSEKIASGVDQVDRIMDNDVPAGSIPVLMSQLAEYEAMADKGLEMIRQEKALAQNEKGGNAEITKFLELKEFEVMASKNRAKYLSNKLRSQELVSQGGEIALLSSASLLETDSDILFSKASLLRDSLNRTEAYLVKKQLYAESFALEDTALSRQNKAIAAREQALREKDQAKVEPKTAKSTEPVQIITPAEKQEGQTAKVADKPVPPRAPQTTTKAGVSDKQLMESTKTLSGNIASGVAQIDEIMEKDIPAGSIPVIQGKLQEYQAMADQGLEEIQKQKLQVQQEKGSDSDIAMFLELKEFEIISTRNRARYLANILKAKELSRQDQGLAMNAFAGQLAAESEILFTRAAKMQDSIALTNDFLLKKRLYARSLSLEDSALAMQETALSIFREPGREKAGVKPGVPLPAETQEIIRALPVASRTVAERVALSVREQKLPELQGLYYTVQVGVFATPRNSERLMGVTPLFEDRLRNGYYRYFSGIYNSKASATEAKNSIVARGIKDAFIVAIYNGEKLNAVQAKTYEPKTIDSQITKPALDAVVKSMTPASVTPVFRVQLGAFRIAPSEQLLKDFALKTAEKIVTDLSAAGLTLVMTNSISTFDQAQAVKQKAVAAGIKDAFIVGYIGKERTTAARVKEMLNIK